MDAIRSYSPVLGRILMALPLLNFSVYKLTNWDMMVGWMAFVGFPIAGFFLGAAIVTEFAGGLLLIAGYKARQAAGVLFLYLVPVTFMLHNFWAFDGAERQGQVENFGKGLMIMGGLLFILAFGPGRPSVDEGRVRNIDHEQRGE